jgi:hypothetical protein
MARPHSRLFLSCAFCRESPLARAAAWPSAAPALRHCGRHRRASSGWAAASDAIEALTATDPVASADTPAALDHDWINLFASHAEHASGERLRMIWGRILAEEIRKPGSFALSTLRVILELDGDIATTFQELARLRLSNGFLMRPERMEGITLVRWSFLEEARLLRGVSGNMILNYPGKPDNGFVGIGAGQFFLHVGWQQAFHIPVVKLSGLANKWQPFYRLMKSRR